ncbi:MAG: hypothetical protein K0R25_95 [Rickettsiaceae bacterium]|jgi:uncharacterized membrane protein|nr:hypothetical protein [Rickettsiaceae bacterium]
MSKTRACDLCKTNHSTRNLIEGKNLRPRVYDLIKAEHDDFSESSFICMSELNKFRRKYLENILLDEVGELSKIEQEVISSINTNEILSENVEQNIQCKISLGEKLADRVAEFGGSWGFIIFFFSFLAIWIGFNSAAFFAEIFDPYPFILLNLILSCLAAIQAPIIMMSQNRKDDKDRKRSEHDYKINLKAELEIRLLHEKVDHLLVQQNKRFIEIQQIQMDLMEDILDRTKK